MPVQRSVAEHLKTSPAAKLKKTLTPAKVKTPSPIVKHSHKGKWVNPTGGGVRGCDKKGCGYYGARRSGRNGKIRPHEGVDFVATAGQDILAIASGVIIKVGYPYPNDLSYRYVAIETKDGHITRQLYIKPAKGIGKGTFVKAGQVIGTYQELGTRYPDITEHVHVDIWIDNGTDNPWRTGGQSVNPITLIPAAVPSP